MREKFDLSIEKMLTLAENYIGIFYFTFFMKNQDILKKLKCYSEVFQFCQLTIFQQIRFQSKIVNLLFFSNLFATPSHHLLTLPSGSFWARSKDHLPANVFQLIISFSSCTPEQGQRWERNPLTPSSTSPLVAFLVPAFARTFMDRQRWPEPTDRLPSSAIMETSPLGGFFFFFLALLLFFSEAQIWIYLDVNMFHKLNDASSWG